MRTYGCSYMLFLSEEQRDFIHKKAEEQAISSAQYCRMLIEKEIDKEKEKKVEQGI